MTLPLVLFAVVASLTGLSAVMVVLTRDVVRAAVWLLFTLIGTSVLYFLLGADFVGAAQLIVYVGGTMVLVVFGVMLTAQRASRQLQAARGEVVFAGLVGVALFALLADVALRTDWQLALGPPPQSPPIRVAEIGAAFLGVSEATPPGRLTGLPEGSSAPERPRVGYLLPFEAASLHLLVVLIGAAYLARAKRRLPATARTAASTNPLPTEAPV